ncbi:hypothetical protein JRI60_49080 [Archangium violaceum]|uniref:hypothetical protein n=1 Tax=Archangium violaceum TaxID=83451 RepID=UPI001951E503|nr:hypothetical protein [Archangium violaceum]QRN96851.1 hypothetical protein JRI60_49080 [Archangium violaceum]
MLPRGCTVPCTGAARGLAGELFTALERVAAPDGGAVRLEAEYLLVSAVAA